MTLKIAHLSDLHYCEKHLSWVDKAVGAAVADAIVGKCDVAVISGDLFDNLISVHHPAVNAVMGRVGELAAHMPVLILQGTHTHDRLGSLNVFKHMDAAFPIHVADTTHSVLLTGGTEHTKWVVVPEDGAAAFIEAWAWCSGGIFNCLPSLNPAEIRANDAEATAADAVAHACDIFATHNDVTRAHQLPSIMVSHGTVVGCITESKHAMVSQDHEFLAATLFNSGASAILLGHIHAHQSWHQDGCHIAYAGSITSLVYGHTGVTGYLVWEVSPTASTFRQVGLPARVLLDLDYPGQPDMADIARQLPTIASAFVRLRYVLDEEFRGSVDNDQLRKMLIDAGAAEVVIEPRINPVIRSRAAGIGEAPTVAEKVAQWCALTNTAPEPLLMRLSLLEAGRAPGARP